MSVAVALPSSSVLSVSEVASALMSFVSVIIGAVVSTTSTILVAFALLPASSVAVQVIAVFPIGNMDGASLITDITLTASVAFAFSIFTTLSLRFVASIVMSFGTKIEGGVVSLTITD